MQDIIKIETRNGFHQLHVTYNDEEGITEILVYNSHLTTDMHDVYKDHGWIKLDNLKQSRIDSIYNIIN